MARRIPKLPVELPTLPRSAPAAPILAGSAALAGAWYDLAGAINLGYGTGRAQVMVQQTWPDGQLNALNHGGAWTELCRWRIPIISAVHNKVQVSAYCSSASGFGQYRVKSRFGGGSVSPAAIGAALQWWDTANQLTVADGGVGFDCEELILECWTNAVNDLDVFQTVWVQLSDQCFGAWPGGDGVAAAGPAADGYVPLDDGDVQADAPCSSDVAGFAFDDLDVMRSRPRIVTNWSSIDVSGVTGGTGMELYSHRCPCIVPRDGCDLTVWVRASNTSGGPINVAIKHGPGSVITTTESMNRPAVPLTRTTTLLSIPNGAAKTWYSTTVALREGFDVTAPAEYAGLVQVEVAPEALSGTVKIHSVSIWGV